MAIVLSLLQSVLKIEDPTLGLITKLFVMIVVSLAGSAGLIKGFDTLTAGCIQDVSQLIRQAWS